MRLVLVHGINQEGKIVDELSAAWVEVLRKKLAKAAWPDPVTVEMPFYGDVLFELTKADNKSDKVTVQGEPTTTDGEAFADEYAEQLRKKLGITNAQVAAASTEIVEEQGPIFHNKHFKAVMKVVQKVSPFHGDVALRLLAQAHAYLTRGNVTKAVDDIVRPSLQKGGPMVVVAHSLGTIVTYKLLRQMARDGAPADVKLYMTLGSPLGIASVKKALSPGLEFPGGVGRWVNGGDPDDFVALETKLKGIYQGDIVDLDQIKNGDDDKHSITDYLANKTVYGAIAETLP